MFRDRGFCDDTKSFLTSNLFSESSFDKEVETLLREFDKKCAKMWDREDQFEKTLPQPLPPPTPQPKFETRLHKPQTYSVKTTTNSLDNKGTYRSELHIKEFPKKKSASRFLGILTQEKTLACNKFEVNIDISGFELNEITIKTEGYRLLIRAKTQKPKGKFNGIYRELMRDYLLPDNVNPYDVTAMLVSHGQLHIEAPIKNRQ